MKWSKDKCQEEALKYNNRNEFKKNCESAYRTSINNNWLTDICHNMLNPYEINLKWNKGKCREEALKYEYKSDFKKGNGSAYNSAYSNKWLDEICSHMIKIYNIHNYWNKEKCQEEALKYNTRNDFKKNKSCAYKSSRVNKWLDEICSHMIKNYKTINYYTKEICKEEALKYISKSEFSLKSHKFYIYSLKMNWMNEICSHMTIKGNRVKRCIYAYEFTDNHVYIGLTYNIENRNTRHLLNDKSCVFKHIEKTMLTPKLIQLTDYIDINISSKLEGEFVEKYKINDWIILNKIKTGGVGGNISKWNKEKCQEEALKYDKKCEFKKCCSGAYHHAYLHKFLNDICHHMN